MNVLIIGGGSIGERHLRCFQAECEGEVALCETDDDRREAVGRRYGLSRLYSSIDAAATDKWQAAVICTPAHLHVDHALALLSSVEALMIEKPLATKTEDAVRLVDRLDERPANVAYVYRASPAVQEVKRILDSGELGRLLQATVVSGQHFPTYRPAYREIYYRDRRTGGGAVQDAATHTFNLLHYLAGRFDWIYCDYAHQALEGVDVEDVVHMTGRCQNESVLVSMALNQFMAPNESRIQFNCEKGSLQLQTPEHRWGIMRHGEDGWTWSEPVLKERDDLFRLQARAFLDACKGIRPVLCTIDDAMHTLKVNLAALESAGAKRVAIEP